MNPDSSSQRDQCLVEQALARDAEELRMRLHRVHHLLGIVAPAQFLDRHARMAGLEVRVALVVEVVHQAGDAPRLLVGFEPPRIRADGGLDGQHVLAQRVRFGPLAHQLPGLVARRHATSLVRRMAPPYNGGLTTYAGGYHGKRAAWAHQTKNEIRRDRP